MSTDRPQRAAPTDVAVGVIEEQDLYPLETPSSPFDSIFSYSLATRVGGSRHGGCVVQISLEEKPARASRYRVIEVQATLGDNLIVMGTHGRRAISHVFLGSIAERVVREAACPVITIRQ